MTTNNNSFPAILSGYLVCKHAAMFQNPMATSNTRLKLQKYLNKCIFYPMKRENTLVKHIYNRQNRIIEYFNVLTMQKSPKDVIINTLTIAHSR